MSASFTPGPWLLTPCACGNQHCKRQQFSNVGTFYMGTGFEPADAALIAAAPELYEALAAYVTAQGRMCDKWADGDEIVKRSLWRDLHACEEAGRRAIAKARGESPHNQSNPKVGE